METTALAGPARVAWKVNREKVLLLAWGRAILMQFAHPAVAAGVAEHSSFRGGLLARVRRLRRTLDTMFAFTFGSGEDVARAARRVNAIHDRVRGDGYSARDPALLAWVHATLLDSFLLGYELYVGPLSEADKDRYCAEAAGMGPLLGVPPGGLPTGIAALRAYMAGMADQLLVTDTARSLAAAVLAPPLPRLVSLHTAGLLPPGLRAAYGFPWDARREAALRRSVRFVRSLVHWTPAVLRHWAASRRRRF